MSWSLGPALALVGLLVLLALALQGWWSTRRLRPRRGSEAAGGDRVEPAMEGEARSSDAGQAEAEREDTEPMPLANPPRRAPRLDGLIDAIVPLALDAPISGEHALLHQPTSRRAGGKPFYIEGLDAESGAWEPLAHGRRYGELQAGVQLASRSGALGEIEYSEFVHKVQAFADAIGASAVAPDMLEVVARARELDSLCSPLDMQLAITLRSQGVAWSLGYLQQIAGRLGFVPGSVPGRLVLPGPDEGGPPMLVIAIDAQAALADDALSAALRECTLEFDVPQTPQAAEPFPAWHRAATELAADMEAAVIDGAGKLVTLQAYAGIGRELQEIYRRLDELGLPAGSPAARRLFN